MSELEIYKGMMKNMKLSDNTPYLKKIEENSKHLLNSKLISDTEWKEYQTLKKQVKIAKDLKQFVYDELVDRNVSGATETHDKIINLLNTLNGKE